VLPFSSGAMWLREPVFWYGIVAPVALLVIVTLYLFWLDRKAGSCTAPRSESKWSTQTLTIKVAEA